MLKNAYFVAKIGADTAENEQQFAEICEKLALCRQRAGTVGPADLRRSAGVAGHAGVEPSLLPFLRRKQHQDEEAPPGAPKRYSSRSTQSSHRIFGNHFMRRFVD